MGLHSSAWCRIVLLATTAAYAGCQDRPAGESEVRSHSLDSGTCNHCTAVITPIVSLGGLGGDSVDLYEHATVVRLRSGHWIAGPTVRGEALVEFDSLGRFVRSIGRHGAGPGEFGFIAGFAVGADGEVAVVDAGARRLTIFNTDWTVRAITRIDAAPTGQMFESTDRSFVVGSIMPTPARFGAYVYGLNAAGEVVREYPDQFTGPGIHSPLSQFRVLAGEPGTDRFWVAHHTEPLFEHWLLNGEIVDTLRIDWRWFPGTTSDPLGREDQAPPFPWIQGLYASPDGNLLVLVRRAKSGWKRGSALARINREQGVLTPRQLEAYVETRLEWVDPMKRTSLGGVTVSGLPARLTPNGELVQADENRDGGTTLTVYQIEFSR